MSDDPVHNHPDMAWQPIDTARKDGSAILVWDGKHQSIVHWSYSFRRGIDHWRKSLGNEYKGQPIEDVGNWCAMADGIHASDGSTYNELLYVENPTHWTPLPPPPNSKE